MDLGIDSAADHASLALLRGDEVIAERAWHVDSTMSKELLAHLDALLVEAGVTRDAIASIAVTTGPGAAAPTKTFEDMSPAEQWDFLAAERAKAAGR